MHFIVEISANGLKDHPGQYDGQHQYYISRWVAIDTIDGSQTDGINKYYGHPTDHNSPKRDFLKNGLKVK